MAQLLSSDEAAAAAAYDAGIMPGIGYTDTPLTEIPGVLEHLGGLAQWALDEKVALKVGAGLAASDNRSIVTMKQVGLKAAVDPLFSAPSIKLPSTLVVVPTDELWLGRQEESARRAL